jgi:hypothetical protein
VPIIYKNSNLQNVGARIFICTLQDVVNALFTQVRLIWAVSQKARDVGCIWMSPTLTTYNFSENFGTAFVSVIRDFDSIPTVTRDGRVAFVGVDDIAKAAYNALVTEKSLKTDYYVLGPQLYSYDEVSSLPSLLRQPITSK